MDCRICESPARFFYNGQILGKYKVAYYSCGNCGFLQTEEPHWLQEAYSEAIAATDVGLVERNSIYAAITGALIRAFFAADQRFLDYGGGYGLFVRIMRDRGFEFFLHDPKCENLFARGFEADLKNKHGFELVTAFEVFEHLPRPVDEIERMLQFSDSILFSTLLVPEKTPTPGKWWYFSPETGQHVSFYSLKTLRHLAGRFGLRLYTDRHQLHLLTRAKVPHAKFRWLARPKIAGLYNRLHKNRSLTQQDYSKAVERVQEDQEKVSRTNSRH